MSEMDTVFAAVDEIRAGLPERSRFRQEETLLEVCRGIEASSPLRGLPAARALLEDLRKFQPGMRLSATKAHINGKLDNHVFSLFDASYFPKLSLDYLTYETLPTDPHLAECYASPTMPVNITGHTRGFGSRVVVALFPENHIDGIQKPEDLIFYFINKFVERHNKVTRKMIDEVVAPGSFPAIQGAPDREIEQASSWWVRLHEYHHRQGDMPIPGFLSAKSAKPLAGLEELRVDVCGMLACLHDTQLPRAEASRAYEFILAERLLRYAVEGIPRPNYDAVASQLLFNYMTEKEAIRLEDGRIFLAPRLPVVLADFLAEIQGIERRIHQEPVKTVRTRLLDFANQYTDYDPQVRDYRHIPFFASVKQRLGV
ncbi:MULTISPECIES: DUF6421 family protein [unclassified Streptomyces]|uniref:DUF6421 family protein n=1 Tax=Streptomyces sp. NPDC127532 TaxID=3345399 RepID=UPI00362B8A29